MSSEYKPLKCKFLVFFANFASHFISSTYNSAWHAEETQYTSTDGMNQFMNPQVCPYKTYVLSRLKNYRAEMGVLAG